MRNCIVCLTCGDGEVICNICYKEVGIHPYARNYRTKCVKHAEHEIDQCESCNIISCINCAEFYTCGFCMLYTTCSLCIGINTKYFIKDYPHQREHVVIGCNRCGGNLEYYIGLCKDEHFDVASKLPVNQKWLGFPSYKQCIDDIHKLQNYMEDKVAEYKGKLLHLKFLPEMDEYELLRKEFNNLTSIIPK